MHVYYSDPYGFPLPDGHRFPLAKYRLLRSAIERLPASCGAELLIAPRASRDELLLAHDAAYVDAFVAGRLDKLQMQRIGFPWSQELVERTLRSTGGTIAASRQALREGAAAYLAGGTHHARRDRGAGYCVFNDCAVAARLARRQYGIERILIVDTDVHQGDGTADLFAGDPSVFTLSIHGEQNFPARKAVSDLDLALPDRSGDDVFLDALQHGLRVAHELSRPQLVFYLAGADAHEGDMLGRLSVTTAGLQRRDEMVMERCRADRLPVVTVMGGGYGKDLDATVEVYRNSVEATLAYARSCSHPMVADPRPS